MVSSATSFSVPFDARILHVGETVMAVLYANHGNISETFREITQILALDLTGRMRGHLSRCGENSPSGRAWEARRTIRGIGVDVDTGH
jgi:hypothetical protein